MLSRSEDTKISTKPRKSRPRCDFKASASGASSDTWLTKIFGFGLVPSEG
jgi:hypothetical protein